VSPTPISAGSSREIPRFGGDIVSVNQPVNCDLYVNDCEAAVRFKNVVVSILSSQISSSQLRRLCKLEIRKDLERRHHLPPLGPSSTFEERHRRCEFIPVSIDKPHASDVAAMASPIIMTAGSVPVRDSPLRPDQMEADHLAMHKDCDESCYIWRLLPVARNGWDLSDRRYRHRTLPNHPPFVRFGQFSDRAIEKQIAGSSAIADASLEPVGNIQTNPLLSVIRSSDILLSKLLTNITITDEGTMAQVNEILGPREIKLRVCLDLSSSGMNDMQPPFPFSYASPEDAASMMTPGCWMAKLDLDAMFLSMPISYRSRRHFGFRWRGKVFYYKRTPFGGKLFPAVMTAFMAEVLAVARSRGVNRAVGYMDDFLVMGDTAEECQLHLDIVIGILVSHGWTISQGKVTVPAQVCEFLGIVFDSNRMVMTVAPSKAQAVLYKLLAVESCVGAASFSDAQLLPSLSGNLSWFSGVVTTGRLYIRAFYDLNRGIAAGSPDFSSERLREAITWWKTTLLAWSDDKLVCNNVKLIAPSSVETYIYYQGDAGDDGMGFYYQHVDSPEVLWQATAWRDVAPSSSTEKELNTLLWALQTHGSSWSNRVVVTIFDSSASALGINNGTSPSPACWHLLKRIYELADHHSISLAALWTPRDSNTFADMLTHLCVANRVDSAAGRFEW
jgi:hypothetical protein